MKRQLWCLLDLRDGGGLGFTVELFFLALRQLELSSTSSSSGLKNVVYTGTFKAITSHWKNSKNSVGTQRVLLDFLCDLVIGIESIMMAPFLIFPTRHILWRRSCNWWERWWKDTKAFTNILMKLYRNWRKSILGTSWTTTTCGTKP